jgi:7-carboxy-7-deazaguanine synthase
MVNEVFYSIQGEGFRTGQPSIFIRLTGCDRTCGFCDTEFESGAIMTRGEILDRVSRYPCRWIVWTGGEPMLQLDAETVDYFKCRNYQQAIETNGAHRIPFALDWVCVSPKVADHVLVDNFPDGVDELKRLVHAGTMGLPSCPVNARERYLSPISDGDRVNHDNVRNCLRLVLENPDWRMTMQLHKRISAL